MRVLKLSRRTVYTETDTQNCTEKKIALKQLASETSLKYNHFK